MYYEMRLEKKQKYWWDEDTYGSCVFHAGNDEEAKRFVATVVARMNHKYKRIREPRDVVVEEVHRLEGKGFDVSYVSIDIEGITPFSEFAKVRAVLNAFYPKGENGKRFQSMMHMFADWELIRRSA